VTLPPELTDPKSFEAVLDDLEALVNPFWQTREAGNLAGQLILPLDQSGNATVNQRTVHYDPGTGLSVVTDKKEPP
jgi:hypothetical protein